MKQKIILGLTTIVLLAFLIGSCSNGMTDDEKEIAIAVALTQTAAAPQAAAVVATTAVPTVTESLTDTVAPMAAPEITLAPTATLTAVVVAAAVTLPPTVAPPTVTPVPVNPGSTEPLPVTQPAAKVRTLLVAPGEPGPLYALLTDEIADNAPATNAQFLISRNFGESWTPVPSGLPAVADDCLYSVGMDYFGATALFASTCQGIYRWSAAAPTWLQLTEEPIGMVSVVYGNADLIWATRPYKPGEAPLLRSQDGGESWTTVEVTHTTGIANIGVNPRDSQTGYAIVWPDEDAGSDLRRGTLYTDWQIMPTPNGNQAINTGMTIDGGTGNVYVTTSSATGARLWRSTNPDVPAIENVQWSEVYATAPNVNLDVLSSGWSPLEDELSIYANFIQVNNDKLTYALYRSIDSGRTWAPVIITVQ